ncbi:AAA family ATPase [Nocardioides faecalis]|uniref:AAA family ATPase n=1 Tax=Nocardioides faecalis TaxID=2803858 RepID=UPI0035569C21
MSDKYGSAEFSTDGTTPAERDSPQNASSYPQAGSDGADAGAAGVSRETSSPTEPAPVSVSRETGSSTETASGSVSRETGGSAGGDVSRETNRPATRPRTAAELAESASVIEDDLTPLARAAQATVLVRAGIPQEQLPRPAATRVFVVANQKGGVGKTTSTVNIAAALTQLGQRVLVIDLDPQGNASTALNIPHHQGTPSTYEVLVDGAAIVDVAQPCPDAAGLWVVPATIDLAGAEIELVSVVAREQRLKRALDAHPKVGTLEEAGSDRFDYVFIDCPPSLGLLTLNALVAGAEMLIPIQAEYYALEGLGQLLSTVDMVRAHLNPDLDVSTILLTMYDARTRLAAGVAAEVREHFGAQVIKSAIPRSVRVSEAPSYGQTVMTYDPGSPGALSYLEAAREIITRGAL